MGEEEVGYAGVEAVRAFDSNALIYYLNGTLPSDRRERMNGWIDEGAAISVVTRIEVLGFEQPAAEEEKARQFLALFAEVPLVKPSCSKRSHCAKSAASNFRTP